MRQVSKKRAAERTARLALLERIAKRDGGCVARPGGRFDLGTACSTIPGRYAFEGHELVRRSQFAGGHLVDDNVVTLCSGHHEFVTANPAAAKSAGLSITRWDWDNGQR